MHYNERQKNHFYWLPPSRSPLFSLAYRFKILKSTERWQNYLHTFISLTIDLKFSRKQIWYSLSSWMTLIAPLFLSLSCLFGKFCTTNIWPWPDWGVSAVRKLQETLATLLPPGTIGETKGWLKFDLEEFEESLWVLMEDFTSKHWNLILTLIWAVLLENSVNTFAL